MESHKEIQIFTHTKKQQSPVYIVSYVDFPCIQKNTAWFMVKFDIGKLYEKSRKFGFSRTLKNNKVQCIYCHSGLSLHPKHTAQFMVKFDIGKLYEKS
jgi:hypothetical protein